MIRLHTLSAFIGVAVAAVCLGAMSLTMPSPAPLRIEYVPHPRDMVQIREGVPYVVPVEKNLVITGLGARFGTFSRLLVDGVAEFETSVVDGLSVTPVPTGFRVTAGSTVTVTTGQANSPGRAWGFLTGL